MSRNLKDFERDEEFGGFEEDVMDSSEEDFKVNGSLSYGSTSTMSKEEVYSLILNWCKSQEEVELVVSSMQMIIDHRLAGQINKSAKDVTKYWKMIKSFSNYSDDEKEELLSGAIKKIDSNAFDAVRRLLWEHASPNVKFGVNPSTFGTMVIKDFPILQSALEDIPQLIEDAYIVKIKQMSNAFKSVCACMPRSLQSGLTSPMHYEEKVREIIAGFNVGVLPFSLNPNSYKVIKEAGATLPHTLEPKEFIGVNVSLLLKDQFGPEFVAAFDSKDVQDVRLYGGGSGDYILVAKEGVESPYAWEHNPVLYCTGHEDDGLWTWRHEVKVANAEVSLQIEQGESAHKREELKNRMLIQRAQRYVRDSPVFVQGKTKPYLWQVPKDKQEDLRGARYVVRFAKRGISTMQQVLDNTEVVHLVSNTVAGSLDSDEYYPISLPDFNTVVLFPMDLWRSSAHYTQNGDKVFNTQYGVTRIASDFTSFQLYLTLFRISHTLNMFDSWRAGTKYSYVEHVKLIERNAINSKDLKFRSLFGKANKKLVEKVVKTFAQISYGSVVGMWISPATSKMGKSSVDTIHNSFRFTQELSSYDSTRRTEKRGFLKSKKTEEGNRPVNSYSFGDEVPDTGKSDDDQ